MKKIKQLLDYATKHPDAIVTYRARDMILAVHSNTYYTSETNSRIRAGGEGFFVYIEYPDPLNNGAILTIAQIIKTFMFSASEAELVALYIN